VACSPLDVLALASVALMSPGHFSRSFRAAFGETPYSYPMTCRIERARALLRRGDLTVTGQEWRSETCPPPVA
jgi:transcriptional regulator GlxA family with amidase domain